MVKNRNVVARETQMSLQFLQLNLLKQMLYGYDYFLQKLCALQVIIANQYKTIEIYLNQIVNVWNSMDIKVDMEKLFCRKLMWH